MRNASGTIDEAIEEQIRSQYLLIQRWSLAALAGSLVGALGSATGTWITARHQEMRNLLGKQIARREPPYSDFIGESVRLLVDAMEHNTGDLQKVLPVYALLSRIRLSSSEPVLQEAEKVIRIIINTYAKPNLTAEQIESRAANGNDPLGSSARRVALNWIYCNNNCRFHKLGRRHKPRSAQRGVCKKC